MKINYTLGANNEIVSYYSIPFNESLPYIEIEDSVVPILGVDKIINGKFVRNSSVISELEELYSNLQSENNKANTYRQKLKDTDYLAIKYAEGILSETEYAESKTLRESYREYVRDAESNILSIQERIQELKNM